MRCLIDCFRRALGDSSDVCLVIKTRLADLRLEFAEMHRMFC